MADVPIVQTATSQAIQYGVVGVLCLVFALVIYKLYTENRADRKQAEQEREAWAKERQELNAKIATCTEACRTEKETLRAMYETKHREILEGYSAQLRQVKTESDGFISKLGESSRETSDRLADLLEKMLERIKG